MSGAHAPVTLCKTMWGVGCHESLDRSGHHRCKFQAGHVKRCQCICWQRKEDQ